MQYRATCFTFMTPLGPGDYTIPFEFDLPNDIPATIMWEKPDSLYKPYCSVKHSIKAELYTQDNKKLKFKQ